LRPFDLYPRQGRELLGPLGSGIARREYGYKLYLGTGLASCAYCGVRFSEDYYYWLLLSVDHVVPRKVAVRLGIPAQFYEDAINMVLACSGCNTFGNRFDPTIEPRPNWTVEEFVALRDELFAVRMELVAQIRQSEIEFFEKNWKTRPSASGSDE
jgi:hypothetical protein